MSPRPKEEQMESKPTRWEGQLGIQIHVVFSVPEGIDLDPDRQGEAAAEVIDRVLRAHEYPGVDIRAVRFSHATEEDFGSRQTSG